jgi:membrane protease YdiL (CAAX protease family)
MTSDEPLPPPEEPVGAPEAPATLPIWLPFAALLGVLVIVNLVGLAVIGVLTATDASFESTDDLPDGASIPLTFFQDLVFVYAGWIAVKLALGRATREEFGLVRPRGLGNALKWAAIAYGGFWFVTVVLSLIFGQPDDQSLVTDIKQEDALGILIAWGVLICVIAPIVEEFFFRGFMFTVFSRRLGLVWGALLTGVVFGLGHAPAAPIQLIALGAFGVGLCLLYWRTQSIIPCMALHALNNSITFGLVKELDPALFAGVVVLSVGTVVAGASAVSARTAVAA